MKTSKELIVELVAGLGSWTPNEGKVAHAVALLAEIERACPEDEARSLEGHAFFKVQADCWRAAMDKAVAEERERCAKIAEDYAKSCASSRDEVDGICEAVAELIRGAK